MSGAASSGVRGFLTVPIYKMGEAYKMFELFSKQLDSFNVISWHYTAFYSNNFIAYVAIIFFI